jgi:hypothetical protein
MFNYPCIRAKPDVSCANHVCRPIGVSLIHDEMYFNVVECKCYVVYYIGDIVPGC